MPWQGRRSPPRCRSAATCPGWREPASAGASPVPAARRTSPAQDPRRRRRGHRPPATPTRRAADRVVPRRRVRSEAEQHRARAQVRADGSPHRPRQRPALRQSPTPAGQSWPPAARRPDLNPPQRARPPASVVLGRIAISLPSSAVASCEALALAGSPQRASAGRNSGPRMSAAGDEARDTDHAAGPTRSGIASAIRPPRAAPGRRDEAGNRRDRSTEPRGEITPNHLRCLLLSAMIKCLRKRRAPLTTR